MNSLYAGLPHWTEVTVEQEQDLARKVVAGDLEAAKQLVYTHLSFVGWVVSKYRGYGLPQEDLMQEGAIGLMKAVKAFDPEVGVRLCSFAYMWIKNAIHEYVLNNWRIVKVATTKNQRKLFFNLRRFRSGDHLTHAEATTASEELGIPVEEVYEMEGKMFGANLSIDDDNEDPTPGVISSDMLPCVTEEEQPEFDFDLIQKLNNREKYIIQQRYLIEEPKKLVDLGAELGISTERVRQIEKQSILKLRELGGQYVC